MSLRIYRAEMGPVNLRDELDPSMPLPVQSFYVQIDRDTGACFFRFTYSCCGTQRAVSDLALQRAVTLDYVLEFLSRCPGCRRFYDLSRELGLHLRSVPFRDPFGLPVRARRAAAPDFARPLAPRSAKLPLYRPA
jgi:hypothetical protein